MEELIFEHPEWLWALLLIPFLLILFYSHLRWKRKSLRMLGDVSLVRRMIPHFSMMRFWTKFIFFLSAFTFLILSLSNPQIGMEKRTAKREGVDVLIALDVSRSMLAEDLLPNRLEKARQFARKFINELENDRVGLMVFAGNAYLQMPLTIDHSAAKLFLKSADPDMIPTQGTNFHETIDMAIEAFNRSETKSKLLLIISDGEDHQEGVTEAIQKARKQDIIIHTVGIGTEKGAPIPEFRANQKVGYKYDRNNNIVVSKLNSSMLALVAAQGDGIYIKLSGSREEVRLLKEKLEELDKSTFGEVMFDNYTSYYQLPLFVSLLFLTLYFLMNDAKRKSIINWSIFQGKIKENAL